jgi:hypothetical protein
MREVFRFHAQMLAADGARLTFTSGRSGQSRPSRQRPANPLRWEACLLVDRVEREHGLVVLVSRLPGHRGIGAGLTGGGVMEAHACSVSGEWSLVSSGFRRVLSLLLRAVAERITMQADQRGL